MDAETKRRRMTRAPLRITPNFQRQEKRRPKTDVENDLTYGAFLTEESLDIAGKRSFIRQHLFDCGCLLLK